ncbi:MAG: metal-dependent hydrolase [Deltaproteobacteria bacterium]|nr:metal-dependent hydrolase [Deltaproteobacteria bacterium]
MPSPIFHSVAAVAAAAGCKKPGTSLSWPLCALLVLAANLPDLDLAPAAFLGTPTMLYHHGFTHSFGFGLLAGLLLSLVPLRRFKWRHRACLLVPVGLSHPFFDLFNSNGSLECRQFYDCGQPLAWPLLSRKWGTLYPVFGDIVLPPGILSWFSADNLRFITWESCLTVLVVAAVFAMRALVLKLRGVDPRAKYPR